MPAQPPQSVAPTAPPVYDTVLVPHQSAFDEPQNQASTGLPGYMVNADNRA